MCHKIHFHSDCSFFAGCENMLTTFFGSKELRAQYDITFSYRYSRRYEEGLNQKAIIDFEVYPLLFPDIYDFSLLQASLHILVRRIYFFVVRIIFTIPLLISEIWKFYRLMKRIKPDIIHINAGGYPTALSARAAAIGARIAKVPSIVMVVNNMAVGYESLFRLLDYPIDRILVNTIDKFVTGSTAASERLKKVLHLSEYKVLPIYNGISFRPATLEKEKVLSSIGLDTFEGVIFGIVGLLIPRKGHRVLLDAVIQLSHRGNSQMPSFQLVIVGNGPLRTELEDFVNQNGISQYCIFVGERNDVMNYMQIFDALVLSSIENEDFPFVILEAMSYGKPVIASKVAGTVEQVVHQKTGILVDPGKADQVIAAMQGLAASPSLREQMGNAGYDYFLEHFSAEVAVSKYMRMYANLLAEKI